MDEFSRLNSWFQQKDEKMSDPWCATCPLYGRGLCPETPEYIEGCKKFSERMRNQSTNRKVRKNE